MAWTIADAAARAAWVAAESQQDQLEALQTALGSAPRLAVLAGSELSRVTLADPTINTGTTPRQLELGALVAGSLVHTATGTPTRVEVRHSDGTVILRADAGVDGGAAETVEFFGAIKALCAPSVGSGGIVVRSNSALPASPDPEIFQFLDAMDDGECLQYDLPSLTVSVSGEGLPFGPSPDAAEGPFDWLNYMPWDSVTKQFVIAGGRDKAVPTATKVMWFDAVADVADSIVNPWGVGTGHVYQSPVVIPERGLLFFRGFHTGALLLWDINTRTDAGTIPAVPGTYRFGENPAWAWFPDWGTYGSLVVVGRDVDAAGVIVGRYAAPALAAAFDTGTWQAPVYVSGLEGFGPMQVEPDAPSDGSNTDHPTGCYVPLASAGIFGSSSVWTPKKLLVVPSGGATPYWTGETCPGGVSALYAGGTEQGSLGLMTPHPTRAAAVIISRNNGRMYTYEFAADDYIDRRAAPAQLRNANQGVTTIPEADGIVVLRGTSGAVGNELWCFKVGSSLG